MRRLLQVGDDVALGGGIRDPVPRRLYRRLVAGWQQRVACAAQRNRDLAVLDLGLPRMDGIEVLRRLRDSGSNLPVLIAAEDATEDCHRRA